MAFTEIFDKVKIDKPQHNRFNLSHSVKTTADFGKLIPIMTQECLPGDKFTIRHELAAKFAPMMAPIMSEVDVKLFSFKVPFRNIWKDFEDFITKGEDGDLIINRPKLDFSAGAALPYGSRYLIKPHSLADYLEFPTLPDTWPANVEPRFVFDQLPFRAYWFIFNEYFRDQNLEEKYDFWKDSVNRSLGGNASLAEIERMMQIGHIAWYKDYFTSALPWTQRGPVAKIPIELNEVNILQRVEGADFRTNGLPWEDVVYNQNIKGAHASPSGSMTGTLYSGSSAGSAQVRLNTGNLYGVAENVQGTINDLRTMYAVQRWYERNALGGSRYTELIRSHFGVTSSDARLQRPEFLGMSTIPIIVNEVLQTSQSTTSGVDASPLGQPAGHAFGYDKGNTITTFCEEHCFIMTLMAIVPKAEYYQGMPRKYMRDTTEDMYWPLFAHLGEDAVYNGELYYQFGDSNTWTDDVNKETFGYQSRFADLKFAMNRIHGDFKSAPLNTWHLARRFTDVPQLNSNFIRVDSDRDDLRRIWAYEDSDFDHIWLNIYNHVHVNRQIPVFSTPI